MRARQNCVNGRAKSIVPNFVPTLELAGEGKRSAAMAETRINKGFRTSLLSSATIR